MHRGKKGERVKGRREERREGRGADSTWQPLRKYTSKRFCQRWDQLVNAEERSGFSGRLKNSSCIYAPQWQRSRAAEQAAETEKVRGRRWSFLFYFFFCGKKVLTQILGAGDTDGLEQVEKKCYHFRNTVIYAQYQQLCRHTPLSMYICSVSLKGICAPQKCMSELRRGSFQLRAS